MVAKTYLHSKLTGQIIGIARDVYQCLGPGHTEKVYEKALLADLIEGGVFACSQARALVRDERDRTLSVKVTDILVEDKVAFEIKTLAETRDGHREQLLAWMRAQGIIAVGLVLNFGSQFSQARVFEPTCWDARQQ